MQMYKQSQRQVCEKWRPIITIKMKSSNVFVCMKYGTIEIDKETKCEMNIYANGLKYEENKLKVMLAICVNDFDD